MRYGLIFIQAYRDRGIDYYLAKQFAGLDVLAVP